MTGSSLFSLCPSCRTRANIQHAGASYRCLSCNFDFARLAQDQGALEHWMVENLREGSVEMTVTLLQLITQVPEPQARARVQAVMQQHGLGAPTRKNGLLVIAVVAVVGLGVLLAGGVDVAFVLMR